MVPMLGFRCQIAGRVHGQVGTALGRKLTSSGVLDELALVRKNLEHHTTTHNRRSRSEALREPLEIHLDRKCLNSKRCQHRRCWHFPEHRTLLPKWIPWMVRGGRLGAVFYFANTDVLILNTYWNIFWICFLHHSHCVPLAEWSHDFSRLCLTFMMESFLALCLVMDNLPSFFRRECLWFFSAKHEQQGVWKQKITAFDWKSTYLLCIIWFAFFQGLFLSLSSVKGGGGLRPPPPCSEQKMAPHINMYVYNSVPVSR